MLRRVALASVLVATLSAVLAIGAVNALRAESVRAWALQAAGAAIERQTDLRVAVRRTAGDWPFHIVLHDVTVAEGAAPTPLLDVERIELRWRPLGLLVGQYDFAVVEVTRPRLARLPAMLAKPPSAQPSRRARFPIPPVTVDALRVTDAVVASAVVPGGAAFSMDGGFVRRPGLQSRVSLVAQANVELGVLDESPLASWHGRDAHVEIAADLTPRRVDLHLATVTLRESGLEIRNATATPDGMAQGRVSLGARAPQTLVASRDRFTADARLFLRPGVLAVSDVVLASERVGVLSRGAADVALADDDVLARVNLTASPNAVRLAGLDWTVSGDAALTADLSGPWWDLNATLSLTTPAARIAALRAPALSATARVNGLPTALDAHVVVRPQSRAIGPPALADAEQPDTEPEAELVAHLRSDDWAIFHVDDARVRFGDATVAGNVRLQRAPFQVKADAALTAPRIEALAPNAGVTGDLAAEIAVDAQQDVRIDATATSDRLATSAVALTGLEVTARGPIDALDVVAAAATLGETNRDPIGQDLAASLQLAAAPSDGASVDALVRTLSGVILSRDVVLAAPTRLVAGADRLRLEPSSLRVGADGTINLAGAMTPERLSGSVTIERVALPELHGELSGAATIDTAGLAASEADEEAVARLGRGRLRLTARPPGRPPVGLHIGGGWDGDAVDLSASVEGLEEGSPLPRTRIGRARLPARLEMAATGPRLDLTGDADVALDYRGSAAPLFSLAGLAEHRLIGDLTADARLQGPYDALEAAGAVTLSAGAYTHDRLGVTLDNLDARLAASGSIDALTLDVNGRATNAGGAAPAWRVTGALRPQLGAAPELDVTVALDRAWVVRRDDVRARASGIARLAGPTTALLLSGDVAIDSLETAIPEPAAGEDALETVRVVRLDAPSAMREPGAPTTSRVAPAPSLALDVGVTAEDRLVVRGRGLESAWRADLRVRGDANAPRLVGDVEVARGGLDFAGRRLELTTGVITFTGEAEPDPLLSVEAETTALTGERLRLTVTGRASDPTIALSSEPALPQEDVLALLLFGRPVTELTAFEAVRLAQAAAALSGTGPFGGRSALDRARQSLGLDVLRLTQSQTGDAGLTVGKYVTDRILVTANQDVTGEAGSVAIAIRLTDALSLQTDVGQDASGAVGVSWRRDY